MALKNLQSLISSYINISISQLYPIQPQSSQARRFAFPQISLPQAGRALHTLILLGRTISSHQNISSTYCRLSVVQTIISLLTSSFISHIGQGSLLCSFMISVVVLPGSSLFYHIFPFKCAEVGVCQSSQTLYSLHLVYVC